MALDCISEIQKFHRTTQEHGRFAPTLLLLETQAFAKSLKILSWLTLSTRSCSIKGNNNPANRSCVIVVRSLDFTSTQVLQE